MVFISMKRFEEFVENEVKARTADLAARTKIAESEVEHWKVRGDRLSNAQNNTYEQLHRFLDQINRLLSEGPDAVANYRKAIEDLRKLK